MNPNFYDGTKLLSMKDLNGKQPEIYMCTSNRSAGKTTFFSRYLVRRFLKYREKFCLVYRFKYEIDNVADKFYKDIGPLFFPQYTMRAESRAKGIFYELYLCSLDDPDDPGIACGYALSLNSADALKKFSHLLSDTSRMFFDEFQSETNHYCAGEIQKFISVHTSIARGKGKQVRFVPVIMCSNPISILNPYFISLGVSDRLRGDTKFLRGNGYVLEQSYNESASASQIESAFNTAFASEKYVAYSAQNVYLNDNLAFIEHPSGRARYICTIKADGENYALKEFPDSGILYCDNHPDLSFPNKLAVTTEDHNINYVMLRHHDIFIEQVRFFFDRGCFRFKNLQCKQAVLKMLSY